MIGIRVYDLLLEAASVPSPKFLERHFLILNFTQRERQKRSRARRSEADAHHAGGPGVFHDETFGQLADQKCSGLNQGTVIANSAERRSKMDHDLHAAVGKDLLRRACGLVMIGAEKPETPDERTERGLRLQLPVAEHTRQSSCKPGRNTKAMASGSRIASSVGAVYDRPFYC